MARGPQGQYRPADPIATAVTVARIATGETTEQEVVARAAADRRSRTAKKHSKSLEDKSR